MTKNELKSEIVYLCECFGEGVAVSRYGDEGFPEVGLAFWRIGNRSTGWRTKLRHIRGILKYGTPSLDDVILDPDTALALGEAIKRAAYPTTEGTG